MKKEKSTGKSKAISAEEFDAKFDAGESVIEHLDLANAVRRVNVDFPQWVIEGLDKEAGRLGIPRQALIKVWVAEKLDSLRR